jgi:SH3-like domain-containing protein
LGISAPVVLLVAILLGLLSKQTHQRIVAEDGAVVMLPRVEVKNGPSENTDEPNLFVLHEGTVVKLMRSEGDWRQIRLSNGNTGWIKANVITGI